MSATQAWALTDRRLAITDDDGANWRAATPSGLDPQSIDAVDFTSPQDGWIAAVKDPNVLEDAIEIFSTKDGGLSWDKSEILNPRQATVDEVELSFVDNYGFALVGQQGNMGSNGGGHLYSSSDGGATWMSLPTPPVAVGSIEFISASEGWLEGGVGDQKLWRTVDGGRSWSEVKLNPPSGFLGSKASFGLPKVDPNGGATLAVAYTTESGVSIVAVYVSADRGISWSEQPASLTPLQGSVGSISRSAALTNVTAGGVAIQDPGNTRLAVVIPKPATDKSQSSSTTLPALSKSVVAPSGLPGPGAIDFVNSEVGLSVVTTEQCVKGTRCIVENGLFFSEDGGQSWHQSVSRP